jgi:hypothetical protein
VACHALTDLSGGVFVSCVQQTTHSAPFSDRVHRSGRPMSAPNVEPDGPKSPPDVGFSTSGLGPAATSMSALQAVHTCAVVGRSCSSVVTVAPDGAERSSGGARVINECKTRRCCSLPIERINCAWRAVDSAARRGARRRVASSLFACAVADTHKQMQSGGQMRHCPHLACADAPPLSRLRRAAPPP